jgi:hypothetical protein
MVKTKKGECAQCGQREAKGEEEEEEEKGTNKRMAGVSWETLFFWSVNKPAS